MGYSTNLPRPGGAQELRLATLENLVEVDNASSTAAGNVDQLQVDRALVEARIARQIADRNERGAHFPQHLFSDPAWEIILALALAQARQRRLDISSLCESIAVPSTTALRWLSTLIDQGIVNRIADIHDRRRKFVELTPRAWENITSYSASGFTAAIGA